MKKLVLIALLLFGVLFAGLSRSLVEAESTPFKFDLRDASKDTALETAPQAYTQEARLASGNVGDLFGQNVKMSGDTAVVFSNAGFRVYVRSGLTWALEATLHPSDEDAVASFPYAMAISGNTVVIAGVSAMINGNGGQGAAYVFHRVGTNWIQQTRLTASDGAGGDGFGRSVAISGDSIIVGAWMDDVGANSNQGSAYVFLRQGETWTEQAHLTASDGAAIHLFGAVVAIDGETAVISRLRTATDPAVYVFVRSGTSWTQQARLAVCEASINGNCQFGGGLAVAGDSLAIGNSNLIVGANGPGGLYTFVRSGGIWMQQQLLTSNDGQHEDGFGSSVGLEHDSLIVSSPAGNVRPASAYHFTFSGNTWTQKQKFQEPNGLSGSVAISGPRIILGASSAAYIYTDGSITPTPTPTPTPTQTPTVTPTPSSSPTPPPTVFVSGRVTTPSGLGLRNAVVSLTSSLGVIQTATTSSFGVYSFSNIAPGEQYLIGVNSKRFRFASQALMVNGNMTNVDFVGLE